MAAPTTLILVLLFIAPVATAVVGVDASTALGAVPAPALAPAPAGAPATPAPERIGAGPYNIGFRCPGTASAASVATPTCPAYVLDREDIMAQPILLVDPQFPNDTTFNALHGGKGVHATPGDETPTERSRDNVVHQTHTTFRSGDGGAAWEDQPYHAPDSMTKNGRQIFGEDNAATLDGDGRLYLASLYSYRDSTSSFVPTPGPVHYAVGVWKSHRIDRPMDYNSNVKVLLPNGSADSIFLTYDKATDDVVLLWRETPAATTAGAASGIPFLQVYSTKPKDGAIWTKHDAPIASGCTDITNPLVRGPDVFVGCRTQGGQNGTRWEIDALDTKTWTSRHVDDVGVTGKHGLLLARGEAGFMVLIASGVGEDGHTPTVKLAYGENGARWSDGDEVAPKLTQAAGQPIGDARVTAAVFAPESGNIHLIYMERIDAARTGSTNADRPEFTKVLASIQAEGAFQGLIDLQVGRVSRVDFSPTLTGVGNGAYADLHDSLVLASDGREFIAYGDYGFVRYAQVVETDFLPVISPLGAQTPAIPLASGGVSPALYGVPAGLLSGAMITRTLMARRKTAVEAPSE